MSDTLDPMMGWTDCDSDVVLRKALLEIAKLYIEEGGQPVGHKPPAKIRERAVDFALSRMDAVISGVSYRQSLKDLEEYYAE